MGRPGPGRAEVLTEARVYAAAAAGDLLANSRRVASSGAPSPHNGVRGTPERDYVVPGCGRGRDRDRRLVVMSRRRRRRRRRRRPWGRSGRARSGRTLSGRALSGRALSGRARSGRALSGRALSGRALSGRALSGRALSGTLRSWEVVPHPGSKNCPKNTKMGPIRTP